MRDGEGSAPGICMPIMGGAGPLLKPVLKPVATGDAAAAGTAAAAASAPGMPGGRPKPGMAPPGGGTSKPATAHVSAQQPKMSKDGDCRNGQKITCQHAAVLTTHW